MSAEQQTADPTFERRPFRLPVNASVVEAVLQFRDAEDRPTPKSQAVAVDVALLDRTGKTVEHQRWTRKPS